MTVCAGLHRFLRFCGSVLRYLVSLLTGQKTDVPEKAAGLTSEATTNSPYEERMNGLKTARVLIIDDKPEEIAPVMAALGQLGVGARAIAPPGHESARIIGGPLAFGQVNSE